jgi:predicted phosphoribosyltransferase
MPVPSDLISDVCALVERALVECPRALTLDPTDYAVAVQMIATPHGPELGLLVVLTQPSPIVGDRLVNVDVIAVAKQITPDVVERSVDRSLAELDRRRLELVRRFS